MTRLDFQIDSFMMYCSSKNLAKKTIGSVTFDILEECEENELRE